MMTLSRTASVALVAVLSTALFATVVDAAGTCNGMGRRWCLNAHRSTAECPKPCQLARCIDNDDSKPKRGGGWRDVRTPTWEEIALSGLYEFVYTDSDWLCLATCWYRPENSRCRRWDYWAGDRYCRRLSCSHDDRNRYSGCHADPDGRRKLPWHRPTCKECLRVFPVACGNELTAWVAAEDARIAEEERVKAVRAREMAARRVCYERHFGDFHPEEEESESSSSSSRRRRSSSSSDDDEPDSETLKLYSAIEEELDEGTLECPPPQCLTSSTPLVQRFHAPSPPPPPPPASLFWYHSASVGGFCNWENCQGGQQGDTWCRQSASQCVRDCGGTWCPPESAPPAWSPVTAGNFVDPTPDPTKVSLEREQAWVPPTDFNTSMCGASITNLTSAEADGLSWELTRDPYDPDPANDDSASGRVANRLAVTGPNGLSIDDVNSALAEQGRDRAAGQSELSEHNADDEYDADYDEVLASWDVFVSPSNEPEGRTVVYITFQLENAVGNDVESSGLVDAAVELTGVAAGNVLVLEDPANEAAEAPYSGVVMMVATSDTDALVTKLESLSQEDFSRALSNAGATYLPWSMAVSTHSAPAELVANLDYFQSRDGLSSTQIALLTSAIAVVAAGALIALVWVLVHRKPAHTPEPLSEPKKSVDSSVSEDAVSLSVPPVSQA